MALGWRQGLASVVTSGILFRSLAVAIIVGTVLNLINQGKVLLTGASLDWLKLLLNYVVPFAVSTHGAVSARMANRAHSESNESATKRTTKPW